MSKYDDWGEPFRKASEEAREHRRNIILAILIPIIIIGGFTGLAFGVGWLDVGYKNTVGIAEANADRNIFKENKSYVEGMISDLAKYKYELTTEKDKTARKAIIDLIIDKYADFDMSNIEDEDLEQFLKDVKNGDYEKENK